jgi:glycosyltransferase involved in cell wall biosynthesis
VSRRPSPRVLQVALGLDPGGTERMVIELTKRVRERHPVMVCCLDAAGAWAPELTSIGVPVENLQRQPGFHPSLGWNLARVARRFRASVLHCHHYSPFVHGRIAAATTPRLEVIFTEHGRLSDAPPSRRRRRVNRFLCAGVKWLFAVSHDLRRHMLAEGFPPRLSVVWNGIDPGPIPSFEDRRRARVMIGATESDYLVGTIARLDPVKDLGTLIDACAEARRQRPGLRLVIIGDGPERQALSTRVQALGLNGAVIWAGQRGDARTLLAGLDLYANSSISEGVSITLLEAMAAALPIVATEVGGTPEVVLHEHTGLLCPPRAPAALADALLAVSGAPDRSAELARAGRDRVERHFSIDEMVQRYASLYDQAA